jgi:plastocyanin
MNRWSLAALPVLALGIIAAAHPSTPPAVHRVRMLQAGSQYKFDPATLTIKVGDVVEFVNVTGGPHNIQFDKDHIPAGAKEVLNRAMAQRMGDLQGPFLTQPNQVYRISFAGAPKGAYTFSCLPHQALGMKGTITVE